VSAFTSANTEKILALNPDLVIGFSDLQADIAADLVRHGQSVLLFNHRSVEEILGMILTLSGLVGAQQKGEQLVAQLQASINAIADSARQLTRKPLVYFEEWDDPMISAIRWVSDLIGIAGGEDCFAELAEKPLGKDRIIADPQQVIDRNPDIIVGSWCGKKFRPEKVAAREGWSAVKAVANQQLYEIKSVNILQPGPAALTDGLSQLHDIVLSWQRSQGRVG
jgi:iron complex transport system substrate-binding protein